MTEAMPLDQYRPYNSIDGDRRQRAEGLAAMIGAVLTDGVMPSPGDTFFVSVAGGWDLSVAAGKCVIAGGRLGINVSAKILTLDPPNGTQDRIDSIILRHDEYARLIYLRIGKGTPSANPAPVALQRDADAYEMCVAQVRIGRTATSIAQSAITDTRQNGSLCGIVNSLITVDATTLFAQYNAAFEEYFAREQAAVDAWRSQQEGEFEDWSASQRQQQEQFQADQEADFDAWFAQLQADLDGNVAAALAARIETVALKSVQEVSRVTISVPPENWVDDGEEYTTTVAISSMQESYDVEVTPMLDSVYAPVLPVGTAMAGGLVLYASSQPEDVYNASVIIRKVGA